MPRILVTIKGNLLSLDFGNLITVLNSVSVITYGLSKILASCIRVTVF